MNGFVNMKSNSEMKELNLHCLQEPQATNFNDDRDILALNQESQSACDVAEWSAVGTAGVTGVGSAAVGAKLVKAGTISLKLGKMLAAGPAALIAGAGIGLAYCLTQSEFKGSAIRVTKNGFPGFEPDAAYPFDTRCHASGMAYEVDCFPQVSFFIN